MKMESVRNGGKNKKGPEGGNKTLIKRKQKYKDRIEGLVDRETGGMIEKAQMGSDQKA